MSPFHSVCLQHLRHFKINIWIYFLYQWDPIRKTEILFFFFLDLKQKKLALPVSQRWKNQSEKGNLREEGGYLPSKGRQTSPQGGKPHGNKRYSFFHHRDNLQRWREEEKHLVSFALNRKQNQIQHFCIAPNRVHLYELYLVYEQESV